jgi:SOS-response transcriptional repressor LexA
MPGQAKEPGPVSAIETERGLTEAQQLTLNAVRDYIEKHGIPPSFRDVMRARKLVSTSAVQEAFRRLQAVGAITVREGVPRSVRVLWSKPKVRRR